jgi:hypothetical protein
VRPRKLALCDPLHGEFLALLGAVEKIKIDQLLVRETGFIRQALRRLASEGEPYNEIVQNLRAQANPRDAGFPTGSRQVPPGATKAYRWSLFLGAYGFFRSCVNCILSG